MAITCLLVCPVKLLCGLEASQGAVEEVVSSALNVKTDTLDSSDDLDPEDYGENEIKVVCKKKNKRRKGIICHFDIFCCYYLLFIFICTEMKAGFCLKCK